MKKKVSVLVAVYNHEKYLEECLNSIVNQKTTFEYEILVHDDCSTDNSKKIIENFYREYPEKIVPFYEKENQYSKGIRINIDIMIPKMTGKYFCFCEGDDYWVDENKLQKQFDFLEKNKGYYFCVHNSIIVDRNSRKIRDKVVLKKSGDLSCKDFILGGGGFVATNSIFSYSYLARKVPEYFNVISIDYMWQIYLSSIGKTYCFCDFMSAYRVNSEGSWSEVMSNDTSKYINHITKINNALKVFNNETNFNYNEQIMNKILCNEFTILELKKDYNTMKQEPYKIMYKSKALKIKLKYFLDEHFPKLYNRIMQIRSKKDE